MMPENKFTSEQMAPLLPEFPFASADARFIRNPMDFVVFDGYTQVKDEKGDTISVVLVEAKKGRGGSRKKRR